MVVDGTLMEIVTLMCYKKKRYKPIPNHNLTFYNILSCIFDHFRSVFSTVSTLHLWLLCLHQAKTQLLSGTLKSNTPTCLAWYVFVCWNATYSIRMKRQACVSIVCIEALWCDVFVIEINVSGWKGDQSINVKSIANVTVIFSHLQASMKRIGDLGLCKWACHCRICCACRDCKQAKRGSFV